MCPRHLVHGLAACFPGVISRCFSLNLDVQDASPQNDSEILPPDFLSPCDKVELLDKKHV